MYEIQDKEQQPSCLNCGFKANMGPSATVLALPQECTSHRKVYNRGQFSLTQNFPLVTLTCIIPSHRWQQGTCKQFLYRFIYLHISYLASPSHMPLGKVAQTQRSHCITISLKEKDNTLAQWAAVFGHQAGKLVCNKTIVRPHIKEFSIL